MKNLVAFILSLFLFITLSSGCVVFPYDTPYGKWKSDNPNLTLHIISQDEAKSTGTYVKDDELQEVFLSFWNHPGFRVQNVNAIYYHEERGREVIDGDNWYFDGKFELKDEKLYYYARWSDLTGEGTGPNREDTRTIVFERVEEEEGSGE